MLYRMKALEIARSQVGIKESPAGSNSGTKVREYQATTTLGGTGWPWCAAFVNWCFKKAGLPLNALGRSASVGLLLNAARDKGWVHNGTPKAGDIVCFDWNTLDGPGHLDWPDHVGIVKKVYSDGSFDAVEGNTAVGNDSNGGQVMVRRRSRSMVEGFIRVPGSVPMVTRLKVKAGPTAKKLRVVFSRAKASRVGEWVAKNHKKVKVIRINKRRVPK